MMPQPVAQNYGDKTRWIKVFADGTSDFTTLSHACAAHTEAGARFRVSGAIQEPESADTSWMDYPTDLTTKSDARIISPAAGQHLHFVKGASLYLGAWRLLALRAAGLSICTEGQVAVDVGQTPHYVGCSIFVGGAAGMDFSQATFVVNATRPLLLHGNVNSGGFIRFESNEYSRLGKWIFNHSRAVTHDVGGTAIQHFKFASIPAYMRHCELDFQLRTAVQTADGWTTAYAIGIDLHFDSMPARSYDSNILTFDICPLPAAGAQYPLYPYASEMQAAGFAGNKVFLTSAASTAVFTGTTGNIFNQAY